MIFGIIKENLKIEYQELLQIYMNEKRRSKEEIGWLKSTPN